MRYSGLHCLLLTPNPQHDYCSFHVLFHSSMLQLSYEELQASPESSNPAEDQSRSPVPRWTHGFGAKEFGVHTLSLYGLPRLEWLNPQSSGVWGWGLEVCFSWGFGVQGLAFKRISGKATRLDLVVGLNFTVCRSIWLLGGFSVFMLQNWRCLVLRFRAMGMASGLRGTQAGHGVRAFEPKLLKSGLAGEVSYPQPLKFGPYMYPTALKIIPFTSYAPQALWHPCTSQMPKMLALHLRTMVLAHNYRGIACSSSRPRQP